LFSVYRRRIQENQTVAESREQYKRARRLGPEKQTEAEITRSVG
jgi:hypothetical protein